MKIRFGKMGNHSSSLIFWAYLFVQNSDSRIIYIVGKRIWRPTTFVFWVFSNSEVFLAENSVKFAAGGNVWKCDIFVYLVAQIKVLRSPAHYGRNKEPAKEIKQAQQSKRKPI